MKFRSYFIPLILLLSTTWLIQAAEWEVKVIDDKSDALVRFCPVAEEGDIFITDGRFRFLFGGTERPLQTYYLNYPRSNAKGSLLAYLPAGKDLLSNLNMSNLTNLGLENRIDCLGPRP